jgi:F420-non-reducing hydrogenase iron-sulfur subunit
MEAAPGNHQTKILILASLSGGYRGADAVGQLHSDYSANTYILPILSAAMFSEHFYLEAFEKGIDAILVMYSGTDSPFKGEAEQTAAIINKTYGLMKERGIDSRRLRLVAICTVCTAAFLREVTQMEAVLAEIGPIGSGAGTARAFLSAERAAPAVARR